MNTQWIVVANAASARIFRRESAKAPLAPVAAFTHEDSRLPASALTTDRPGSQAADNSHGLNHFEPRSDAQRKEHQRFAKEIARRLEEGLKAGEFGTLTLFASAPFMGELKAQLSEAVGQRLKATHNTDLTHVGIAELERRISDARSAAL
jgi:protein required for attachment to host cells